jgi:UDP-N-acetylglucosamine 2-epimerase (non-hydrolysing)
MSANPQPSDLRFAGMIRRAPVDGPRIVLVALDRPDSLGVLAGLPELLDAEPDVEVVLFGELGTHGAAAPIASHPRGTVARNVPLADLVALLGISAVLVSDNPELVSDAPGFGTPALLVDGPFIAEPGDSIRSILSPRVMGTVRQLLAAHRPPPEPSDGLEAIRVEQAVAWMFGLTTSPLLELPYPRLPEDDPAEAPDPAQRES